ncbi:MAG: site-2 protease family protein [Anaerotignum sp.]|nr:site-2 protease family protein [Anaerotignum sp.]
MEITNTLLLMVIGIPGILVATTIHEFTRALLSTIFGDNYPKSQTRLTLNPVRHFEPIGFLLMFYSGGFGWGNPVETSALYYKNRKRDTLLVAILPSVVNLVMAVVFMGVYVMLRKNGGNPYLITLLNYMAYYNAGLALYNCLPVAPMDCVKVLAVVMPANQYFKFMQNEKMIQMIFLFLLFFGLITGWMDTLIYGVLNLFGNLLGMA